MHKILDIGSGNVTTNNNFSENNFLQNDKNISVVNNFLKQNNELEPLDEHIFQTFNGLNSQINNDISSNSMKEKCCIQSVDENTFNGLYSPSSNNLITSPFNDDFNDINNFDNSIINENVFLSSDDEDHLSNFDKNVNPSIAINNNIRNEAESSNSGEKRKNKEPK